MSLVDLLNVHPIPSQLMSEILCHYAFAFQDKKKPRRPFLNLNYFNFKFNLIIQSSGTMLWGFGVLGFP